MVCEDFNEFDKLTYGSPSVTHYYTLTHHKYSYDEAKAYATANGGYLAIPNFASENALLANLLFARNVAWLGLEDTTRPTPLCDIDFSGTCPTNVARFRDINGLVPVYLNWLGNEPDNPYYPTDKNKWGEFIVSPAGEHWAIMTGSGKWRSAGMHVVSSQDELKYQALIEFDSRPSCAYDKNSTNPMNSVGISTPVCNPQIYRPGTKAASLASGRGESTSTCLTAPVNSAIYCPDYFPNNCIISGFTTSCESNITGCTGRKYPGSHSCGVGLVPCRENTWRCPTAIDGANVCADLTGTLGTPMQCSELPCWRQSDIIPQGTPQGSNDKRNDATNDDGSCGGNIYIFNGQDLRCRYQQAFGLAGSCCNGSKSALMGLISCTDSEVELAQKRTDGKCKSLGSYCAERTIFGLCVKRKKSYCCYDSKLSFLIAEEARKQLNSISWGSASNPICRGLSPTEFEKLDFSQINTTALTNSLGITQSSSANIHNGTDSSQSVSSYRHRVIDEANNSALGVGQNIDDRFNLLEGR